MPRTRNGLTFSTTEYSRNVKKVFEFFSKDLGLFVEEEEIVPKPTGSNDFDEFTGCL